MFTNIDVRGGETTWMSSVQNTTNARLHFTPANGMVAGCYQEFLGLFDEHFSISCMNTRGAWTSRPDTPCSWNWRDHALDLISGLESHGQPPVLGMGHSLGGTVTAIAARLRPDLFSKLVIIDAASTTSQWQSWLFRALPTSTAFRFIKFIRKTRQRQELFESPEAFHQRYRNHPTYQRLTEQAMRDYATHGLRKTASGEYQLAHSAWWEAFNFSRVHFIWEVLSEIEVPTLILRAEHSYLYSQSDFERLNKGLPSQVSSAIIPQAHHLAPLEMPTATHKVITDWLSER